MVKYLLDVTNLTEVRKKSVSSYSGGMKQRFGIAQMLLNNPELIIVDEPTAGLDPAERRRFLNVLREIGQNHIVIFSTHIVEDVEELCNDMAIMNGGKILVRISPAEALANLEGKVYSRVATREEIDAMSADVNVLSTSFNPDNTLNLRVYAEEKPEGPFAVAKPALDDVYFTYLNGFVS